MIVVLGNGLPPPEKLEPAIRDRPPVVGVPEMGRYELLVGGHNECPADGTRLMDLLRSRAQSGQETLLIFHGSRFSRMLPRILRRFPEFTAIDGLAAASAILSRFEVPELPTPLMAAKCLGWSGDQLTTPLDGQDTPMQGIVSPDVVEASALTQMIVDLDECRPDVVVAMHPSTDGYGDAVVIDGVLVVRLSQDRSDPRTDSSEHPKNVRTILTRAKRKRAARDGSRLDAPDSKGANFAKSAGIIVRSSKDSFDKVAFSQDSTRFELVIGSQNTAGQAYRWARAVRANGVRACSNQYLSGLRIPFPSDVTTALPDATIRRRLAVMRYLLRGRPCVLAESFLSLSRLPRPGSYIQGLSELQSLSATGHRVGVVFHGSELRRPGRYRENHAFSPFADVDDEAFVARLEGKTALVESLIGEFDGSTYVTTCDLLDDAPHAHWLPQVVDSTFFDVGPPPERDVPVVLHAPTHSSWKGSNLIDPVLRALERQGLVQYHRVRRVPSRSMPAVISQADIVVDQLLINAVSTMAAEAMAAGRVVVSHIGGEVLGRYPEHVPVVDANPLTFEETMLNLVRDWERIRSVREQGRGYARHYHDGSYSADVLQRTLVG